MTEMTKLTQSQTWKALKAHTQALPHMRHLFEDNAQRFNQMSTSACGLFLDYSKNRATQETLSFLFTLADEAKLESKITAMFNGKAINTTENRAVLHTALRAKPEQRYYSMGSILFRKYKKHS